MEQSLERALDLAESVIASAQQRPPKRKNSSSGEMSLYEKLYDIYVEESEKEPEVAEELRSNVNLLEKLLRRESLPCLVVNLYPGKQGYSLMLKGENGSFIESIRLHYEERELLEYLDAQELPPVMMDILEKSPVNVFHQGCVITEIRDYRQSSEGEPPSYQSRHILLHPTMQTLACDVEAIARDNQNWTEEDKLLLESQLILATAEPLCLDPSVSVACTENRLLYNRQKMNTLPMKRNLKRFSTASLNRQQDLSPCTLPPELTALTSFTKRQETKKDEQCDLKTLKADKCVDMWKQRPCDLSVPSEVDVEKYTMPFKSDDLEPTVWPTYEVGEDSIFGYEDSSHSQATKQMLMHPLNDPLISGKESSREKKRKVSYERQMSPHHSFTDDHPSSFLSRPETDDVRMISPSEESSQNSAQCPVQMSHSSGDLADLRQPFPGKEPEQPKNGSVQSSVLGKGAKHPPSPIRLPLNPGESSWGDSFTSQQASSSHKFPSPASAPKLPSLSQKSSMEVSQVSSLPAMALSTVGSSQRTEASATSFGLNITKEVHPGGGGQALGSGSKPVQDSTTLSLLPTGINLAGLLPTGIKPDTLPTGIKPDTQPTGIQPISSQGVQLVKNTPSLMPFTLLQLPPGSLILNTQQQAQEQLQQPTQQWLYQLMPQTRLQQPTTSHPPQSVPQDPGEGSVSQMALSAQQAMVINLNEVESFLQPQAVVLSQAGSVQSGPWPSLPQHRVQLASPLQLHPQPQPVQFRILQHPVATVVAPAAQPQPPGEQAASQSKGKKENTPAPPKS
ncbi:transcription factor SPT20 homolog [Odocoileus virginianus]|uniref:Transcription factor SPT20 homolog n=1 Tax=Odocoileus virginianus TaxID=9874 RepID=A0A6J0WHM6_ODOVR